MAYALGLNVGTALWRLATLGAGGPQVPPIHAGLYRLHGESSSAGRSGRPGHSPPHVYEAAARSIWDVVREAELEGLPR